MGFESMHFLHEAGESLSMHVLAGDVTKGVPSLADLLQSDGETELLGRGSRRSAEKASPHGNVTGNIPSLGLLLEEEETGPVPSEPVYDEGTLLQD